VSDNPVTPEMRICTNRDPDYANRPVVFDAAVRESKPLVLVEDRGGDGRTCGVYPIQFEQSVFQVLK
jgi:hypothetical protein